MKKILLIADLHQQNYVLKNLENLFKKRKFDAVIVAGDLTNRSGDALSYARRFLKIVRKNKMGLFFLHGNCDDERVVGYFKKKYLIHLKSNNFCGYKIIGLGGFGDEYSKKLDTANSIFVTHFPPILSNKTFKDAPKVHIFGHTHFLEYQKKQGKTLLVQLKAAIFNRAAVLELPSLKVNFINLKIKK